jgi:hypothetical protein
MSLVNFFDVLYMVCHALVYVWQWRGVCIHVMRKALSVVGSQNMIEKVEIEQICKILEKQA